MPRPITADDYSRRLQRVAGHLAEHLDEAVDLTRLAAIACFSPHHFHRIYRAGMGETVAETVSRLRLARAAAELARTDAAIAPIARRAGYGSAAAFNRAFSAAYGRPPQAYRGAYRGSYRDAVSLQGASAMPTAALPQVEERAPLRIAAIEHRGPFSEIGQTFQRLVAWAGPRGLLAPDALGVSLYAGDHGCQDADARATVGLTVGAEVQGDDVVHIHEVAGGRHAVLLHRGPYAELPRSYDVLFAWLPGSGEEPADAPMVEVNLNDPRHTAPGDLLTEIRLPLR